MARRAVQLFLYSHVNAAVYSPMKMLAMVSKMMREFKLLSSALALKMSLSAQNEFASTAWNFLNSMKCKRIEGVQRRFICLIYERNVGNKLEDYYNWRLCKVGMDALSKKKETS